jgi:hypothetical protein
MELTLKILGLFLATSGFVITLAKWRSDQLRRDQVLRWVDECIVCLQSIYVISFLSDKSFNEAEREKIRVKAIFDTSILIERGRMFFKNEISDDFGSDKQSAYRGYRPRILDFLIVANQLVRFWPNASDDDAKRRTAVAEDCLKQFVSLAQKEVGRDRAASAEALKGGNAINLQALLDAADIKKLA